MQEEPSILMTRMNRAYDTIYGTLSSETRRNAEQLFYRCQNLLRQRGIKFHQNMSDGKWVLDNEEQL